MAFIVSCAFAITGCVTPYSETPVATNFQTTSQHKLQAAAHWGVISNDLTNKIKTNMASAVNKDQAIYVSSTTTSPFNHAVVGEIIASLVTDGYNVVKKPKDAISLEVETQVLEFSPNRYRAQRVGVASALATGVWALAEVGASVTAAGVATGVIFGAEAATYANAENASGSTPKTEIIINVSASNENRFLAVTRGTYYVSDTDKGLYHAAQTRALQTKEFSVRGN